MLSRIFVGREEEEAFLREKYASKKGELIVIYGRRRVGKTELLKRFLKGRRGLYLLGETEREDQLVSMYSMVAGDVLGDDFLKANPLTTWRAFFDYLSKYMVGSKEKFVLVFDEVPYIHRFNSNFISTIQYFWDEKWRNANVMLVLCGSSVGMMEKLCLSYASPIYGRRSGQIELLPLDYSDASKFFPGWSSEDRIRAYAVVGGIPRYLEEFEPEKGLMENIKRKFLDRDAFLYKEADILLREELKSYANYFSILKAVSQGASSFNEISQKAQIVSSKLPVYLSSLTSLRILAKETPVTETKEKTRNTRYRIRDNYFSFWFKYVYPNQSLLEIGHTAPVEKKIKESLDYYVSRTVEDVVACHIMKESAQGRLPAYSKIGRWWHKEDEIDVVALNEESGEILFCEVYWGSRKIGLKELEELKKKAGRVEWNNKDRRERYALFSRNGFSGLEEDDELILYEPKNLGIGQ